MEACRIPMNDPRVAGGNSPQPASSGVPLQLVSIDSGEPRGALAADPPLVPTDELLEELERESQGV
jgi:phosphoadenosine phosphosulfate reductase